jgi:hypothetical protein
MRYEKGWNVAYNKASKRCSMIYALVANLFNVEQATPCADVGLSEVLKAIDNSCTHCAGNAVVIRLPYAADSGHIRLVQPVLGVV